MDENEKSFWSKSQDELDVKESLIYIGLIPIVAVASFVAPMYIAGSVIEWRKRRAAKKQSTELVLVEDPTETE
jgi:hypothetical protein